MRFYSSSVYGIILTIFLAGCAAQKSTTSSTQGGKYTEDLSVWRPKPEETDLKTIENPDEPRATAYVEPKHTVNARLDNVLDSIDRINLNRKVIDGFSIQVYSGRREEALNAKKTLATAMPELDAEIYFTEPIFRVKVGKYYSRMEAQPDYIMIRKYFPAAIIVPERISLH
ncbi:MAG TPA: hypothetical protein VD816_12640 [Ohtaekwangia sp.]|nr:hypothetical protein [Ohtaekwangia sp.]